MAPDPPFPLSHPARRVLLVLLSGAGNLTRDVIAEAARPAGPGTVRPLLGVLWREDWADMRENPGGQPFWSLTARGRTEVLGLFGLEESND